MCGAKYPPAPATTGMLNGGAIDSAHMALDSDCFSNASASTRRCTPACTRLAATLPVAPPPEPAGGPRSIGLPTAPSASARYNSGIITHEEWGEEIKAVVQPAPGAESGPALTAELL